MNLRLEKFSSLIKKQLAILLVNYQSPNTYISVNSIKISPDLKQAHIYLAVWGKMSDEVFDSISRDSGELSKRLATKLKSKFSPSLKFHRDTGQNDAAKIESLLK